MSGEGWRNRCRADPPVRVVWTLRFHRTALERLLDGVPPHWKAAPLRDPMSLRDFAASGVDALAGGVPLPLLLLRNRAV